MRYLYLPFGDWHADNSWKGTVDRYRRKGHKVIEHGFGWKPLKTVKAADVLIIMGHGGKSASSRGSLSVKQVKNGSDNWVEMTSNDLAEQLEADGLSKTHKLIKSLTCYGAGAAKLDGATGDLTSKTHDYFAKLLAKALGLRGYTNVAVGGYPGTVGSGTDQKKVFFRVRNNAAGNFEEDDDGEYGISTSGQIIWFDTAGNVTVP